jgi:hypothetical protein
MSHIALPIAILGASVLTHGAWAIDDTGWCCPPTLPATRRQPNRRLTLSWGGRAIASLKGLAVVAPSTLGAQHFMFGPMSAQDWHRWAYRHVSHHLRQFEV